MVSSCYNLMIGQQPQCLECLQGNNMAGNSHPSFRFLLFPPGHSKSGRGACYKQHPSAIASFPSEGFLKMNDLKLPALILV